MAFDDHTENKAKLVIHKENMGVFLASTLPLSLHAVVCNILYYGAVINRGSMLLLCAHQVQFI